MKIPADTRIKPKKKAAEGMKPRTVQESRAAARKAHFAAGRTPGMWRGRAHVERDRKAEANRVACRKTATREAGERN